MGLAGDAAIVGLADWKPERRYAGPPRFTIEQYAELARLALEDAGIEPGEVDGLVTSRIGESSNFVPATVAEYCGFAVNFAELVDLGGANAVGMVWRAAAAIELGLANVVVCAIPGRPTPRRPDAPDVKTDPRWFFGASSPEYGSPQAEFEIPYGHLAQNAGYALIAQRYAAVHGYDARAMAKIAVDQRANACANPDAVFHGQPITADDVLASKLVADPLHLLEIVMPVHGGHAVVVARRDRAKRARHRPAFVAGCGEHLAIKSPAWAKDLLATPVGPASELAFRMAGIRRDEIQLACLYDCYTITVLLTLEDAGFCAKGQGMAFIRDHDLTFRGDFPLNTHGGQLSYGQAGGAGGMSQVTEAVRQIRHAAGPRQLARCDTVYVSGTGGVMSEQSALILRGD
ncbi:MAG: thiolase family protein [Myxococcota bacterium]